MKTLKISAAATVGAMLAWWLGIARKFWPAHPNVALFLFAVVICVVLQFAWPQADQRS